MQQQVPYNGYFAVPSDYECPDGQLAAVANLIPDKGALRPVPPPLHLTNLPKYVDVLYIHTMPSGEKRYIATDINFVFALNYTEGTELTDEYFGEHLLTLDGEQKLLQVTSIGNTLILLTSTQMRYYLFKEGQYKELGNHFPELPLSFGLQGEMVRDSERTEVNFGHPEYKVLENNKLVKKVPTGGIDLTKGNNEAPLKNTYNNAILGCVNKFIAEQAMGKGKFIFPFLVRYAFRLYDGTLTMQSSPVLMTATDGATPAVLFEPSWKLAGPMEVDNTWYFNSGYAKACGVVHSLDYAVLNENNPLYNLKDWEDIISSVDIFVSAPIYTYDQNGECKRLMPWLPQTKSVCKFKDNATYKLNSFSAMYSSTFTDENDPWKDKPYNGYIEVPTVSESKVDEEIRNTSNFYLLHSIPIRELLDTSKTTYNTRKKIEVPEDYLQALVARETLPDDYDSHDTIIPSSAFVYNQRLNISGIHKKIAPLPSAATLLQFINYNPNNVTLWAELEIDGSKYVLQSPQSSIGIYNKYLYFGNPNVKALHIEVANGNVATRLKYIVKPHTMLNGSLYFNSLDAYNYDRSAKDSVGETLKVTDNIVQPILNKIYTSEIGNPFAFPLSGINTVGTGEIIGIAAATKALSQGQFGQFPLYAFASDGIWALQTSGTGTYRAIQPVSRDIAYPDTITQTDNSVVFASKRGIMQLQGATVQCISDAINSTDPFSPMVLPHFGEVLGDELSAEGDQFNYAPFPDYLLKSKALYDYANARLIVHNENYKYSYILSLTSGQWGIITHCKIIHGLNSYPKTLAIIEEAGRKLVDFSEYAEQYRKGQGQALIPVMFLTRPLKLGGADVYKTIDTIIQRGDVERGHIKQALYGSRDLVNWVAIASSQNGYLSGFRGSPYTYFRIFAFGEVGLHESIHSAFVQFTPRITNRPR